MKKSCINLRHPQHIDIKQPIFVNSTNFSRSKLKIHYTSFCELSQQIVQWEVICLYNSTKYSHKYEEIRRSLLNYLILTNRIYTKWQQKEFLDLLTLELQILKKYQRNIPCTGNEKIYKLPHECQNMYNNVYSTNKKLTEIENYKYNSNLGLTPLSNSNSQDKFIKNPNGMNMNGTANNQLNKNQRSRINRYKQSIISDVDRTYFKKGGNLNKNIKSLPSNYYSEEVHPSKEIATERYVKNNMKISQQITQQHIHEQPYPYTNVQQGTEYYATISTQLSHVNLVKFSHENPPINHSLMSINKIVYNTQELSQLSSHQTPSSLQQQQSLQQNMQNFLKNVLINISNKYPSLGYIQGFNYIVKNMYMTGFTQQESYRYLSYFIECKHLGNIVLNNMLGIRQLSYVLKVYIFNYIPKIYRYLIQAELEPQIFCTSWFVTLFSEDLSCNIVNKLWHIFALEGWKIFIKFGIALLCAYQDQILRRECDDIFSYMRRIIEKFNEQIKENVKIRLRKERQKEKTRRNNYYFKEYLSNAKEETSKKEEIVWKLMTSIQVNGAILNQLCRQMNNLQKDSEIEIWRIQTSSSPKNLHSSRVNRTFSDKQDITNHTMYQNTPHPHEITQKSSSSSNLGSWGSIDGRFSQQLCCDRMAYIENVHGGRNQYGIQRRNSNGNMFALCHNVGPYID